MTERTLMIEPVNPGLRHGLLALDRSDVGGFSVVVPSHYLGERNARSVGDQRFPPLRE